MSISKSDQVLLDSAKDLQTTYDDVKSDITQMRGQLENLQSQWVGRGGQAFQNVIVSWQGKADKVLLCMETFKEQLTQVESTYTVTEDDVSSVFNKYAGGLG
jgi:WXG100 family type VII secretion target